MTVLVTSQNGLEQRSYALLIYRLPSSDASLVSMVSIPSFGAFSPATLDYAAACSNNITAIQLTAVKAHFGATLTVQGLPYLSNTPAPSIALLEGGTRLVRVDVIAQALQLGLTLSPRLSMAPSGIPGPNANPSLNPNPHQQDGVTSRSYIVRMARDPSTNAALRALSLSYGMLSQVCSSGPDPTLILILISDGWMAQVFSPGTMSYTLQAIS